MADIFAAQGKGGLYNLNRDELNAACDYSRKKREEASLVYNEQKISYFDHVFSAYRDLWIQDLIDLENRFLLSPERLSFWHGWSLADSKNILQAMIDAKIIFVLDTGKGSDEKLYVCKVPD